jgi:hypothetical protein
MRSGASDVRQRSQPKEDHMTRTLPHPAVALGVVAVLVLAGCSSGGSGTAGETAKPTAAATEAPGVPGDGMPGGGGISGLIASVSDGTMQVQETDSQTAVTWTDETVVTRTATVAFDQVTVGSCVMGILDDAGTTATSLVVSEPVDGECSAGFGGGGPGQGGDGLPSLDDDSDGAQPPEPTEMPDGGDVPQPTEMPDGGGIGGFGQVVSGLVTAVAGTTITVDVTDEEGATTSQTVEASADTVVTTTVAADASAIEVGQCAAVDGETDDRGGMTASTIRLSEAGEDGCSSRMGGMRPPSGMGNPPSDGRTDDATDE